MGKLAGSLTAVVGIRGETYKLRTLMGLGYLDPNIILLLKGRGETHEGNSSEPTGLNEWPDQETVKVVILPPRGSFSIGQTNLGDNTLLTLLDVDDIVCLEASQSPLEVNGKSFGRVDELATEE